MPGKGKEPGQSVPFARCLGYGYCFLLFFHPFFPSLFSPYYWTRRSYDSFQDLFPGTPKSCCSLPSSLSLFLLPATLQSFLFYTCHLLTGPFLPFFETCTVTLSWTFAMLSASTISSNSPEAFSPRTASSTPLSQYSNSSTPKTAGNPLTELIETEKSYMETLKIIDSVRELISSFIFCPWMNFVYIHKSTLQCSN